MKKRNCPYRYDAPSWWFFWLGLSRYDLWSTAFNSSRVDLKLVAESVLKGNSLPLKEFDINHYPLMSLFHMSGFRSSWWDVTFNPLDHLSLRATRLISLIFSMEIFNTFIVVLRSPRERFYNKELFIITDDIFLRTWREVPVNPGYSFSLVQYQPLFFPIKRFKIWRGGESRRSAISTNSWEIIFSFNFQY